MSLQIMSVILSETFFCNYDIVMGIMKLICAPMATLTHAGFRCTVEKFGGCDEYYTEMINAGSLVNGGPFEKYYINSDPVPEKVVWQLTGKDTAHMVQAAAVLAPLPGIGIDLNMGCSAPDIMNSGAGIAWMLKPVEQTREMVHEVKAVMQRVSKDTGINRRLSVKLRLGGEDFTDENFFAFTDMLVSEGVTQLTLHPRTGREKYRLAPRWEYVERLAVRYKQNDVSVILNGAVHDEKSMNAAVSIAPHADGIMIARGAATYPWIFAELRAVLNHASFFCTIDREQTALDFLDMLEKYQPLEFRKTRMQRFFEYYCLGFSFAHYFQTQMLNAKSTDDARGRVRDYFRREKNDKLLIINSGAEE